MQPFQCDLQTQTQETHRTTYTVTSSVAKHIEGTKRPQPHPPHKRGTFHRRLQPLYTEKHKVSCSGFLPTTKPMQHSCSHSNAICKHKLKKRIELRWTTYTGTSSVAKHIEGTKRPQPHPPHRRGTFHRRLEPLYTEKHKVSCSGFLPTTWPMQHSCSHYNAICHSSPLPIVTTSLPHHFPSSPLPFLTTSLPHHFPSSAIPSLLTSLPHHFPSPPLPFLTTSHRHHFPSSPLPFITTSLRHHFPSSPLPFLTTSHRRHFLPSSPLPFITTSLRRHFRNSEVLLPNFLWLDYVLLYYVLLYDLPPFVKVNFIASYSFVMYWYIMYCYMIYHPSSRSISLLLILLWCIGTLCIVTWSTTLHHSQLHQVKVIRNSEVLLPNFLWQKQIVKYVKLNMHWLTVISVVLDSFIIILTNIMINQVRHFLT